MATSCRYEFQLKLFGFADAKPSDFYVSQWFASKTAFVCYRAVMLAYCIIWTVASTVYLTSSISLYYIYLSNWAEWTLVVHFGIALAVAIFGLATDQSQSTTDAGGCWNNKLCQDELRWFHRLSWVVMTACISIEYVVTVVFWSFLGGSPVRSVAFSVHQHAMNSVLITIDLFMSTQRIRFFHFIYPALYGLTYILFTVILYGVGIGPIYKGLLDWQNLPGATAGLCLGLIFIGTPILNSVVFGLYHLRAFIARSMGCGQRSADVADEEAGHGEVNAGFEMRAADNGRVPSN